MFDHISKWSTLKRVTKLILGWKSKAKRLPQPTYDQSVNAVVYYIQRNNFPKLISQLSGSEGIKDKLASLNPFLDDKNLVRVSGRLNNALAVKNKFPLLLPKSDRLVKLLIDHYHRFFDHAGPVFVRYHLSLNFWILSARQVIRSGLHKCIPCFKARPRHLNQQMGQLPYPRVNQVVPFLNSGVDYAGPFIVKRSAARRSSTYKVWVCVFICMATKAVHLELASSLSASGFIDVLKRFVSRRGVPANIYCDNGTNFVGGNNQLRRLWRTFWQDKSLIKDVTRFCEPLQIMFHFNVPSAPHQGGLWERAVRSMKFHLTRVLQTQIPTWETLNSIVIHIEGILNSRPLTPMSSEPGDLEALTPGHFLIGRPLYGLLEGDNGLNWVTPTHFRWRQQVIKYIWDRWKKEYLLLLYPRSKWHTATHSVQVNDLVLIDEPDTPPLTWVLGRVIELLRGKDGLARSARVKTQNGILLRPFNKLCKLPLTPANDD